MLKILYKKNDLRYIFIDGDKKELLELEKYLNKIPQYMFLPSFRGVPKPIVFLNRFKMNNGKFIFYCYSGLWKTIYDWCQENNVKIDGIDNNFKYTDFNMTLEDFTNYVKSWNLTLNPYEYQIKAAWLILKYRFSLSQIATRGGKTLIAYMIFRYMLEHGAKKILMIVPSIHLVKQGVEDMSEYQEFFTTETIWAKGEYCSSSNLTIGTFQSLVKKADKRSEKYDPNFFKNYDVICLDEAHTAKCESINKILNPDWQKQVKLRFGFSGSLPKSGTIERFMCDSLMGPQIQDIRAKELMNGGFITPIEIHQIYIHHNNDETLQNRYIECGEYLNGVYKLEDGKKIILPKEQQKFTIVHEKSLPYAIKECKQTLDKEEYIEYLIDLCKANGSNLLNLEQMLVHQDEKRVEVMDRLLTKTIHKNCIIFAHHVEYLKWLYKHFKETFPGRPIYIINGAVNLKKRQEIVKKMLEDKEAILLASYACVGTGLTLKNIDYGIFAQSFKSEIINKQALGRGLCLANDKDKYRLYDLVDCFPTHRLEAQGKAKYKLYQEEGFEVYKWNA